METRKLLIIIFTIVLVGVFGVGFYFIGSPEHNYKINVDKQKRADLWTLKSGINTYIYNNCKLPDDLNSVKLYEKTVLERKNYSYKLLDKKHYELCSEFFFDHGYENEGGSEYNSYSNDFYEHKAGLHCFKQELYENDYEKNNCKKK